MELTISPTLTQTQEQRQVLIQEQLQTVKLLQLTSTELRQELAQAMLTNPVLDMSSEIEIPIGDPMEDVMAAFDRTSAIFLPVVDIDNHLVGYISRSRLFTTYRQMVADFSAE